MTMQEQEIIQMKNIHYEINRKRILQDVSLFVEKNRFVGVVGPNGSGKTTLLKHLYRAIVPQKKSVFINGRALEDIDQKDLARQLSIMRQENSADLSFTVLEMTLMGRAPYRRSYEPFHSSDFELALRNLHFVGMADKAEQEFDSLSGGEKQRVLIARSMTQETEVMVLDEPTNHLDVYYQLFVFQVLKNLKKTVIAVVHDLNLAAQHCDLVYVMNHGRIAAFGDPREVLTEDLLRKVFRLNVEVIEIGQRNKYFIYKNISDI